MKRHFGSFSRPKTKGLSTDHALNLTLLAALAGLTAIFVAVLIFGVQFS